MQREWCQLKVETIINERSEFFRSLSEKSEHDAARFRPGPAHNVFVKIVSEKPWNRFRRGLHRVVGPSIKVAFSRIWLICGISLAG